MKGIPNELIGHKVEVHVSGGTHAFGEIAYGDKSVIKVKFPANPELDGYYPNADVRLDSVAPGADTAAAPVIVSLHVEGFGQHATEEVKIARAEWDALTLDGRDKLLNDMAEEHAANHVGYGWHIENPDDMAAATKLSAGYQWRPTDGLGLSG